jgi:hypothetical protein
MTREYKLMLYSIIAATRLEELLSVLTELTRCEATTVDHRQLL